MLPCLERLVRSFLPKRRRTCEKMCLAAIDQTKWDPMHLHCPRHTSMVMREDAFELNKLARFVPPAATPATIRNKLEMCRQIVGTIGQEPNWSFCPNNRVFASLRCWRRGLDLQETRRLLQTLRAAKANFMVAERALREARHTFERASDLIYLAHIHKLEWF